MALQNRQVAEGLLHHSDRGSQYACETYQAILQEHGMQVSMSRTGDCYDNAPMESLIGTLKTELVNAQEYQTRAEARTAIFAYIEGWCNARRRHSSLGYLSPDEFERQYHALS